MSRTITKPLIRIAIDEDASESIARRLFGGRTSKIRKGWLDRRTAAADGGEEDEFAERPDDWMVRNLYELVSSLIGTDNVGVIEAKLSSLKRPQRGPHTIDDQPFKQALRVIVRSDDEMTREKRRQLGDAMEYANRHGVPAKYVVGFIKQVGQKQAGAKLFAGHREPGFD